MNTGRATQRALPGKPGFYEGIKVSLNFEKDGIFIVDILSANSLGFDTSGNLYVGGSDKFGDGVDVNFAAVVRSASIEKAIQQQSPVDTQDQHALCRLDPDGDLDAASEYSVNSNPITGELYLKGGPQVYVYRPNDNPLSKSHAKLNPNHLRIVSYNLSGNFISKSGLDDSFAHIFSFLSPDILVFQEFQISMKPYLTGRLESILGGTLEIFAGLRSGIYQNIIASRFPLKLTSQDTVPPSDIRGVTGTLIDLPEPKFGKDIYVMGLHLQCCDSSAYQKQRQRSADAVISWMSDAKKTGGNITLADGTPMIILGDLNLIGDFHPEVTLRTGDIFDEATFGADSKPDWDDSDLTDLAPGDYLTGNINTWPSSDQNPTIRYDRIFFTDSVVAARGFVLNTLNFDEEQLSSGGLDKQDTSIASDHLPIVVDLQILSSDVAYRYFAN